MTALLYALHNVSDQLFRPRHRSAFAALLAMALLPAIATGQSSGVTEKSLEQGFTATDIVAREAQDVQRLHGLLSAYHLELEESARTLPSAEEIARREAAKQDAQKLAQIPFSVDKVRLNGPEGSTALSQITQRLTDPAITESRRDIAPICSIRTYLFGALVSSERRSLRPVGKNHFVARVRLQPGDTALRIFDQNWEVNLPESASAGNFLITFYNSPASKPELHVVAIDDLLAAEGAHIPAWLTEEVKIKTRAG